MNLRTPASLVALVAAISTAQPAFADTVNLIAVSDNTLYESAGGSLSNGAGTGMFSGLTSQEFDQTRRALVRFDLSSIPVGSTITGAQLRLYMNQSTSGNATFTLHPALATWGEGFSVATGGQGGGAPATTLDATWLHRFSPGTTWTDPGGDFGGSVSSVVIGALFTSYTFPSTPAFVAQVQAHFSGPTNNGWLIDGSNNFVGSAKRFATRETAVNVQRPTLIVDYAPPGTPAESMTWGAVKSLYR